MTPKMAAVAPMPNASVIAETSVKPGRRRSVRTAYRTSWMSVTMISSGG